MCAKVCSRLSAFRPTHRTVRAPRAPKSYFALYRGRFPVEKGRKGARFECCQTNFTVLQAWVEGPTNTTIITINSTQITITNTNRGVGTNSTLVTTNQCRFAPDSVRDRFGTFSSGQYDHRGRRLHGPSAAFLPKSVGYRIESSGTSYRTYFTLYSFGTLVFCLLIRKVFFGFLC